jgi:CHAD domain-containing protein
VFTDRPSGIHVPTMAALHDVGMGRAAPVVKAERVLLTPGMSVDHAVRKMLQACLRHVIGNLQALASDRGSAEHVHQARVGIRRARTVLREFGDLTPAVDSSWSDGLAEVFRTLGASRDFDVVVSRWAGVLVAAGAPAIDIDADDFDAPADVARRALDAAVLHELLGYASGEPLGDGAPIETVAAQRLDRLHRRIVRDARHFVTATVAERHATRKRLKRLRYSVELTASLYRPRRVRAYLAAVQPAQTALGELNDLSVATAYFRARVDEQATAWFAVGWLSAQESLLVRACVRPLREVAEVELPWS